MTLYEINEELMKAFEASMDPETGEVIDEEAYAAMDALGEAQMTLQEKVENVLLWYKNVCADAVAYKAEKMSFADKQAKAERKAESLKRYAEYLLGGSKFKTDRVTVSYRKTTTVEVDEDAYLYWPEDIQQKVLKQEIRVDKNELKKVLKDSEVEGARLVTAQSMSIK